MTFSNFKIVFAFLIVHSATAQDIITISDITFRRSAEIVSNDWGTKDTLQFLITMKEGKPETILTYYSYKDEGADCNNVFWTVETITVQNDSLILSSHYLQKTGIDPACKV